MKLPLSFLILSSLAVVSVLKAAAPDNDLIANASVISGKAVVIDGNNAEATVEPGDFAQRTVWWQWTAPSTGKVNLDTVNSTASNLALQVSLKESSETISGVVASSSSSPYDTSFRPSVSFPVVQGTVYMIGLGSVNTPSNPAFRLELNLDDSVTAVASLSFAETPTMAGDSFANRRTLSGTHASGMGYNASAGVEAGEAEVAGLRTLWWTYTPTTSGRLTLSTLESAGFGKNLAVYLGSGVNSLKLLESRTTSYSGGNVSLTIPVTSGTAYQISVGSFAGTNESGTVILTVALDTASDVSGLNVPHAATLASDAFAQRQSLSGAEVSAIGYTQAATMETGDPAGSGFRTLWWSYRPAAHGRLNISTGGSDARTKTVSVFMGGTLTELRLAARDSSTYGSENLQFSLPVTADTDYQICFGNYSDQGGSVVLTLTLDEDTDVSDLNLPNSASVVNDAFAQRVALTGVNVSAVGYTAGATNEIGEPASSGERTVWWSYQAPATGRLTVTTQGSDDFEKTLAVYQGSSLASLRLVAADTDDFIWDDGNVVTLSFPVTEGAVYQVSVGNLYTRDLGDSAIVSFSLDAESDVAQLNLPAGASTVNDLFANQVALSGEVVSAIGYNPGAGREGAEPTATKERTLWWSWTAPRTGLALVDLAGSDDVEKWVSVWTGSSLSNLSQVALSSRGTAPVVYFPVTQNTVYRIAVGNDDIDSDVASSVVLSIVAAPAAPELVTPLVSQILPEYQPLVLQVGATGLGVSYEWLRDSSTLSGVSGANYYQQSVSSYDAGVYSVLVTSPGGTTLSYANVAVVSTLNTSHSVEEGEFLELTVDADGPGLSFQWFRDGLPVSNTSDSRISGATKKTLEIAAMTALDTGTYHCQVSMPDYADSQTIHRMNSGSFDVGGSFKPVAIPGGPYDWYVTQQVDETIGTRFDADSITITGLPRGLTYDRITGVISGRPETAGSGVFRVLATNESGSGPEREYAYTVHALDEDATGTFNGLVDRSSVWLEAAHGGSLGLVIKNTGFFTGKLSVGLGKYSLSGRILDAGDGTAVGTVQILRKGLRTLTLTLEIDLENGHLTGTLSDGVESTGVEAWRNEWSKANPAGALAVSYTVALAPPDDVEAIPQGDGVCWVTVSSLGAVKWKGTLADGTAFTGSTTLGPNGQVALHHMLYSTRLALGSLQGWLTAHDVPATDSPYLDGECHWQKADLSGQKAGLAYRTGFPAHDLTVLGSRFSKPNNLILGLPLQPSNAQLLFAEGGLVEPLTVTFDIGAGNKPGLKGLVLPPKFSVKLNTSTGQVSGSFNYQAPGSDVVRAVIYNGVLVNRLGVATGYFLLPQIPESGQTVKTSPQLSGWLELGAVD